jgi:hypothetical protein
MQARAVAKRFSRALEKEGASSVGTTSSDRPQTRFPRILLAIVPQRDEVSLMNRPLRVVPAMPDRLMEELATALVARAWFEFKPLFLLVYASLRQRKAAHGGEEMLRLRTYDKLQTLVRDGVVEKTGKLYRGRLNKLSELAEAQQQAQNFRNSLSHAK